MAFNSELLTGSETLSSARTPAGSVKGADQEISAADYTRFCTFLEKSSGILLGQNKEYLVKNRLRKILEETREQTFGELLNVLENGAHHALRSRVIDAMTTNETLWFRDIYPFEILNELILPEFTGSTRGQSRPVRIWSAASSTGQEAYSISIIINEYLARNPGALPHNVEIIATDISPSAINQAKQGIYDNYEIVRGLNDQYQQQYFIRDERDENKLRIKEDLKQRVRFQELNLLDSYALLGQFEVIFCRNVLIYFSNDIKADILSRMARSLKPGGYLFLGGSEPIANYSDKFDMIRCKQGVVYQLKQS